MSQITDMQPLLTASEVAGRLRVTPSIVYRWANTGALRSVRFAGSVRFPVDAVAQFIDADQPAPTEGDQ